MAELIKMGRRSQGIVGPQSGAFTLNATHPLAEDLAFIMYAPSGYVDLTGQQSITTGKDPVRIGERGAYFPYTVSTNTDVSPGISKPSNSEWATASLTDFTRTLDNSAKTVHNSSPGFWYTIENLGTGALAIYSFGYKNYTTSMDGRGWQTTSLSSLQGSGDGFGYVGGEYEATLSGGMDTAVRTLDRIDENWNDSVYTAFWLRNLTPQEHALIGNLETSFLWDLLQPTPKKTYFLPPAPPLVPIRLGGLGNKTHGLVGPQDADFRVNQTHPLAEGLEALLYAPAGYVDLALGRSLTSSTKGPILMGERGAYFSKTAGSNGEVVLNDAILKPLNGEWALAGLTDFSASLGIAATLAYAETARHFTLESSTGSQLAIFDGSSYYNYSGADMNGTGWRTHSVTAFQGGSDGRGYIDGVHTGTIAGDISAAEDIIDLLGDSHIDGREWNDCVWVGFWNRGLTNEEQTLIGHPTTSFLWDLLQPRPKRTIFLPVSALGQEFAAEVSAGATQDATLHDDASQLILTDFSLNKKTHGIVGPQSGNFTINQTHPLAEGLLFMAYAPAGEIDLAGGLDLVPHASQPPIQVGERGAYFPRGAKTQGYTHAAWTKPANSEWSAAGLTDFTQAIVGSWPTFMNYGGTQILINTAAGNVMRVWNTGDFVNEDMGASSGWRSFSVQGAIGDGDGYGYIDGQQAALMAGDVPTGARSNTLFLGDSGRPWNDTIWGAFWTRALTISDRKLIDDLTTNFLWSLLQVTPKRTYSFNLDTAPRTEVTSTATVFPYLEAHPPIPFEVVVRTESKTRGIVGPQTGAFTVNQAHPLAQDLDFLMYAPAGWIDVLGVQDLTLYDKDPVQVGERGAYFPRNATSGSRVVLSPGHTKPANSEWAMANLTDWTTTPYDYAELLNMDSRMIEHDWNTGKMDIWSGSRFIDTDMRGTGWRSTSVSGLEGGGDGYGWLDGDENHLLTTDLSNLSETNLGVFGNVSFQRSWNDCVYVAFWNRALTREERGMIGNPETSFFWDLLQARPKRRVFDAVDLSARTEITATATLDGLLDALIVNITGTATIDAALTAQRTARPIIIIAM